MIDTTLMQNAYSATVFLRIDADLTSANRTTVRLAVLGTNKYSDSLLADTKLFENDVEQIFNRNCARQSAHRLYLPRAKLGVVNLLV